MRSIILALAVISLTGCASAPAMDPSAPKTMPCPELPTYSPAFQGRAAAQMRNEATTPLARIASDGIYLRQLVRSKCK